MPVMLSRLAGPAALASAALPHGLLKAALANAYGHLEALSEAALTRYRDILPAPGVRRAIPAPMSQTRLHNPIPTPARIKVPTLWLWGEKDGVIPIGNASVFLSGLPQAVLVRLPNLGHAPFEEDPVASLTPAQLLLSGATR